MAKVCVNCGRPRVRHTVVNRKSGERTYYCRACAGLYSQMVGRGLRTHDNKTEGKQQ